MRKNHFLYTTAILASAACLAGSHPQAVSASADTPLIGIGAENGTIGTGGSAGASGTTESVGASAAAEAGYIEDEAPSSSSSSSSSVSNDTSYDEEEWSLILVNKTHPIPDGYVIPELTQLANGNSIDSRVYPHLQEMFDAMRAQGIYPTINSSYRTYEIQQQLMDEKIQEYENSGYQHEEAVQLAEEWVAIPGTSEHQLGLGLDISGDESAGTDPGSVWYWLELYAADYGFIKRYPEDKTEITGIINEPWHYRYVGVHAAKIMKEENLCLEEYLERYA